ncbi:hypothetical protein F5887DRAFT_160900 [Amanita rubescens]|nr:hypothetical protein F5887DRAFT_160900 [Amanita rubescens]
MASASGCLIAGHFTLYQPTASRHIEKTVRRYSRLGTPVPEHITRPLNPCNAHLRRAPRFRSNIQQSSARQKYQQQEPWRSERQRVSMLPNISSFGRRRDEASKYTFPSLSQTNQDEQQRGSRHVRSTEPETSSLVCMSPPSFPPRRPHRTHCSPKSAQDERYEGHRSASIKSSSYVRADEEYHPRYTNRRPPESPSYVPPSTRRARPARSPTPPPTNRWSFNEC